VLDGVRSKLADQRMSLMDASTAAKGLAEAYTHGSAAGEQFQRNLANNQQIDNLKNLLNQPNLPAGVAASARGQIATLSANNGFNDSTASWTAGGQVAREQTNQTNQNRLLQSDINAGMFASDASLAAGRASVQADITLSSPTPPTNPNTGQTYTKEELTTAAAMNEQIRQTASTTAQARQGFEHMGDAAMKSFEDAVVGGARVKVMVHALAQDIERTLLQTFVENPLKKMFDSVTDSAGNAIEGYIGSLFGGGGGPTIVPGGGAALGAVLHRNFAQGGLLNQPTTFYANGGTVTGGEQDTEAIMPLKRLPNGNLGVAANGGGGNSIIVNSPITIQGGGGGKGGGMDPATMKLLQAQMENMHTAAVRNVLAQQQRDGGDLSSMGKAWS
jgi:phage-related minor tail protein